MMVFENVIVFGIALWESPPHINLFLKIQKRANLKIDLSSLPHGTRE